MSFEGFFGSSSGSGDARLVYTQMATASMPQPVFNSPGLSLALVKPKMEALGEMGLIDESFDPLMMGRGRDDEYESRSGSDNFEGASGDDQDNNAVGKSRKKKKYHRHTPYQIQELEASFKDNPHPDEKARLELGKKLALESKQVKFWFQNRRTQMKTQLERHENLILKQENNNLCAENIAIKEATRNPICNSCGGQAILGDISIEEHHLRIENARLREELKRVCVLAEKFLGRTISSLSVPIPPMMSNPPMTSNSNLELAVGINGFGDLGPMDASLPMGLDFGNGASSRLLVAPPTRSQVGMTAVDIPYDKSMFLTLALNAMDELEKLAQIDDPLWIRSLDGKGEALNHDEYMRTFLPCVGMRPSGFITDATRSTATVAISSLHLVETLMDANRWEEMFPDMIGRAYTIEFISRGTGGSINGGLQVMHAESQVISPLVPIRQLKFLRFCKQRGDGLWAVVDVSVDAICEGSNAHNCRRLPSGCLLKDMQNGYSEITWVEHSEYDESAVHNFYKPLLRSGMGFGAQRWVATLQRQASLMIAIMSSAVPSGDHPALTLDGKKSLAKLAQRMTRNFCSGVCATVHKWEVFQDGKMGEDARLMIRKGVDNPSEPAGFVLTATMSVWIPVPHQRLFELLQNEQLRSQWDHLAHGGQLKHMIRIAKGQDRGNCISVLRATATTENANQNGMVILQETSTDSSGSLVVYAAVDIPSINAVMNGGDSELVGFLPSGFAIAPDCSPVSGGSNTCNGASAKECSAGGSNDCAYGSLLTVGFQILLNDLPAATLSMESVNTVNNLISGTIRRIKDALQLTGNTN